MSYFNYCLNESCPNHRGLAGWSDRPLGAGAPLRCPLCGSGIVYTEQDDPVFMLPEQHITGRPTGVVLERVPYGGHALEFGDDDASKTYGGVEHPDDRGGYIAELKHDLLLLGYYCPLRFRTIERAARGGFHIHLLGAVLAFKYDLIHEYRVPAEAQPSPPALADDAEPSVANVGPIQYDRSLSSPYQPEFAEFYLKMVGQRERGGVLQAFDRARARWNGSGGWLTINERQRTRHRGAGPYIQRDVRARDRATLVDTRPERQRSRPGGDFETRVRELVDDAVLSPVAGEPDEVELGEAVDEQGLEPIAELERVLTELVGGIESVWGEVEEWDAGTEGQAQSLRDEIARMQAAGETRRLSDYQNRLAHWDELRADWQRVRQRVRVLVARTRAALRQRMPEFVSYRNALIQASTVDLATAVRIKHILLHHTLPAGTGERGVFVNPVDDEIRDLADGQTIEDVIRSCCDNRRVPYPIMAESVQHESGARQATRVGRVRVPVYGVDWNNVGRRHVFDEVLTRSSQWRWSCGWGATQYTSFSAATDGFDHRTGIPTTREPEPPMPPYIDSIQGNIDIGVRLMRTKFDRTAFDRHNPRDCTFETRFDCNRCLLPSRYGAADVNELMTKFKAVTRRGAPAGRAGQYSYYLDLGAEQYQAIFGETLENPTQVGEKIEWPCSWLAAKMHYGGTGPQAWAGLQRTIRKLANDGVRAAGGAASEDGDEDGDDDGDDD
ncbi:MAG: hypothetical protein R6X02_10125 [Enhygromyxa sp.]